MSNIAQQSFLQRTLLWVKFSENQKKSWSCFVVVLWGIALKPRVAILPNPVSFTWLLKHEKPGLPRAIQFTMKRNKSKLTHVKKNNNLKLTFDLHLLQVDLRCQHNTKSSSARSTNNTLLWCNKVPHLEEVHSYPTKRIKISNINAKNVPTLS